MTNIRKTINDLQARGYEVYIEDSNYTMYQFCGAWYVCDECGWISTEEEVDQLEMVNVKEYPEFKDAFIEVVTTNW